MNNETKIFATDKTSDEKVDGPRVAARIINAMPAERREQILRAIQTQAPATFAQVRANIFRFEDIPTVTGNGLQVLVRECDHEDLVMVVKYSDSAIRTKLLANMSDRKKRTVIEDLEGATTTSREKIDAAKERILARIEELRTAGIIRTFADDEVCV